MAYIPDDAKWYLADIVVEIRVEGDARNVVHTNTTLIRADSPEEAYSKAVQLGRDYENSYENPDGKLVSFKFCGLHDLSVIYDSLEHGAELCYGERIGMCDDEIANWITSKDQLGVFVPIKRSAGPKYSSADVMKELDRRLNHVRDPDTIRWKQ